ncbi:MAG TPA: PAS domain S-box protein, partial [Chthonomonadaceae bacterium]|nr:PAS domain S-box protein [Chthonomonadaceae bacterium]
MLSTPPVSDGDLLTLLTENAPEYVIFTTDHEGVVTCWNDSATRALGYTAEEIVGRPAARLWSSAGRESAAPGDAPDPEMGNGAARRICVHKDGSRHEFDGRTVPVNGTDGAPHGHAHILKRADALADKVRSLQRSCGLQVAETHRCIKDSLQTAEALVDISASSFGEHVPRERVKRVGRNIQALAAIHDVLLRQPPDDLLRRYVLATAAVEVLEPVLQQVAGARRLCFDVEPVRLSMKTAGAVSV